MTKDEDSRGTFECENSQVARKLAEQLNKLEDKTLIKNLLENLELIEAATGLRLRIGIYGEV